MESSPHVVQVDPRSIARPPQARTEFDEKSLDELARSIREVGILHPVLLRRAGSDLTVLDGERRILAAIRLSLPTVPALVSDQALGTAEVVQRQLIVNCVRQKLSPLDQARAIDQLMREAGCTAAEAAGRIGRSAGTVSKLLALLNAPEEVKAKLASGEIGLRAAYDLARSRPRSSHKLTAVLDKSRLVLFHGVDSTMDAVAAALKELSSRARAAQQAKMELPTFLALLQDQAKP